jgi:type IV secretory pathway VirB2 component (pilin)
VNNNTVFDSSTAEELSCSSSPCVFNLPLLLVGNYNYFAGARDNAGNQSSTTVSTFTVTATGGTLQCVSAPGCKCTGVSTAIGTISTQPAAFVTRIMSLLLGLAGGIAVLLIIAAGYSIMTSRANPEQIKEARERLLGAIVGLLFVILSLVILEVIGFNILRIPGFEP